MKHENIAFAPPTPNLGEYNQIRGLVSSLMKLERKQESVLGEFDKHICFASPNGQSVSFCDYLSYEDFAEVIFGCLDAFFAVPRCVPKVFVMTYPHGDNQNAVANVENMCRAVKQYYTDKKLGHITTAVLASVLHPYKWVDAVHAPNHLIDEADFELLQEDVVTKNKTYISVGILHNMTKVFIKQKFAQKKAQEELKRFVNGKPSVVFCLGGVVAGKEIVFDVDLAERIYAKAQKFSHLGYNVIIVNGPRTPRDVTDYFYEKSLVLSGVCFYNSKVVALSDNDRDAKNFRVYAGKYEEEFLQKLADIGNIYPAVLGLKDVLAVHTYDSFSCCETASSSVPTAILRDFYIDEKVRPDCHKLAKTMIDAGYAIDFADFDGSLAPNELRLNSLPSVNSVFAEKIVMTHNGFLKTARG